MSQYGARWQETKTTARKYCFIESRTDRNPMTLFVKKARVKITRDIQDWIHPYHHFAGTEAPEAFFITDLEQMRRLCY